jgi:hypothetical protein
MYLDGKVERESVCLTARRVIITRKLIFCSSQEEECDALSEVELPLRGQRFNVVLLLCTDRFLVTTLYAAYSYLRWPYLLIHNYSLIFPDVGLGIIQYTERALFAPPRHRLKLVA